MVVGGLASSRLGMGRIGPPGGEERLAEAASSGCWWWPPFPRKCVVVVCSHAAKCLVVVVVLPEKSQFCVKRPLIKKNGGSIRVQLEQRVYVY